jgi:elongation factor P
MLNATQLKNNVCFLYQGDPYRVLKYKHTHLSRRGADIKVKAKNLKTGAIVNFNFGSSDRFEEVIIEKKKMQFLYGDGEDFNFMDPQSFEQIKISKKLIGQGGKFLKEGQGADILFWQNEPLDLDLPSSIIVEISQCDPGVRGNSATNIFKPAMTKNGLKIKVPLFIKQGDKIKVDTKSGDYVERAK